MLFTSQVARGGQPVRFYGTVDDHHDGTYTARYTIPTAGRYTVAVTLQTSTATSGEALATCVTAYAPFVFSRYYNGLTPYLPPTFCSSTTHPTLLVVHSELDPPSSTYNEGTSLALTHATVGTPNTFTITARDQFGNVRRGDNTTHFYGYGDGVRSVAKIPTIPTLPTPTSTTPTLTPC